jgi:hypothetical protein
MVAFKQGMAKTINQKRARCSRTNLKNSIIMKTAKVDWVFWVNVSFRKWFKPFWTTRGANFRDIQLPFVCISIGLPWLATSMTFPDYLDENTYLANSTNLKQPFSFLVKRKENL